ncbi:MAG: DUF4389 domain-containing protein [Actinomycetes bacterium]
MAVTCQHCGTEAPDDRVMCPNCRRRLRPVEAAAPTPGPASTPEATVPLATTPAEAYGETSPPATDAASDPWAAPTGAAPPEPTRPQVLFARDVTQKSNRLTVFFRFLLAIPHLIVLWALGFAMFVVGVIGWFAALFTGRLPDGLHEFMSGVVRWQTRVGGYLYLLTDNYPPFSLNPEPRYDVEYGTTHQPLNRAAVFFRFILAFPAYALQALVGVGYVFVLIVTWFIVLIVGRLPATVFDASAGLLRYSARVSSYFWLLTPAYPGGLFKEQATAFGTPETLQESEPQPPRQPPAVKRLLIACIVVGALAVGTGIGFGSAAAAKQAHAINQFRKAHDRAVAQFDPAATCGGSVSCLRQTASHDASVFGQFETTFSGLHFIGAIPERRLVTRDTESLVNAYEALARARTAAEFNRLIDTTNLDTLLDNWNTDCRLLDTALTGQSHSSP